MSAAPVRRRYRDDAPRRDDRPRREDAARRRAPESAAVARRRATAERRRRERHYARRRRDLLHDLAAALTVSVLLLCVTAGLGVLALLMVALSAGLIVSLVAERIIRRRRR